jgi:hypothetical protein
MYSRHRFVGPAVLAAAVGLLSPIRGMAGDDEAPRPGQLRAVLRSVQADGRNWTQDGAAWLLRREYIDQLLFAATDPRGATSGGGWYRASESRYGWEWLSKRDRDGDGAISLAEFAGPREWFEALDKDGDGLLTKDDFDWSAGSPLTAASGKARALFDTVDTDSNGQISREEWNRWFDTMSRGKGYLSQDDLIPLFMDRRRRPGSGGPPGGPGAPKAPSNSRLAVLGSYISGDIGSLNEGPRIDELAPTFMLRSSDGKSRIPLSRENTGKPLVLIFGSFT